MSNFQGVNIGIKNILIVSIQDTPGQILEYPVIKQNTLSVGMSQLLGRNYGMTLNKIIKNGGNFNTPSIFYFIIQKKSYPQQGYSEESFQLQMEFPFPFLRANDLRSFLLIIRARIFLLSCMQGVHTQGQCTVGTKIFFT